VHAQSIEAADENILLRELCGEPAAGMRVDQGGGVRIDQMSFSELLRERAIKRGELERLEKVIEANEEMDDINWEIFNLDDSYFDIRAACQRRIEQLEREMIRRTRVEP
jgi:hypothetical protein